LSSLGLPCVVDAEAVRHLKACPRLKELTLGYRAITADELGHLAEWKSLKKLTLIHAQLDDSALAALAKLPTVEEVELEDCGLTDERLKHLAPSPRLTTLTLSRNEIDGPGVAHLAKLRLETLGLEFNNVSDSSLQHLTQLTSVEDLRLAYCRGITDRGIQSGVLQGMSHLKRLNLRGLKQITDASLNDLVRFSHLEHIGIRETSISRNGVQRMQQAMPKTTVFK
jgi:hypothetical protein